MVCYSRIREKKMKKTILVAILFGLFLGSYGLAEEAEWVEYATTGSNIFFYHRESISSPSKDIRQVWIKSVPKSEEDRQKDITKLTETHKGEDFSTFAYTTILDEINCNTRERRTLSFTYYGPQGTNLGSLNYPKAEWRQVMPETLGKALYEVVCPTTKK
jgi:hypothetical protein